MFAHKLFQKTLAHKLFQKKFDQKLFQKKFDQKRKPFGKRFDRKLWKRRDHNPFKKGLTENGVTFGFECLIPKPYQA
jgi:hypothetical protein